jgi:outer membrane protein assembly factor BamB
VVDGKVVFGSGLGGNAVICADAKTGAILWKAPVPHPAFGAPTAVDGKILIGLGNGIFTRSDPNPVGAIVALSLADGKPVWTLPAGDVVLGAVAVDGGRGYAGSRDGHVYVLDVKDGRLLRKIGVGSPLVCSPAVTADAVYVTSDAGKLFCLDRASEKVRWSLPLNSPIIASPAAAGDKVLVGTSKKGFFALREAPGETEAVAIRPWGGPGGGPERAGAADDLGVPSVPADKDGLCEGRSLDRRPVGGPLAACGGRVFVPFEKGLAAVDAKTLKILWETELADVKALAADGRRLYALAGGTLRALDAASGKTLWGPLPAPGAFLTLDGSRLYAPGGDGLRCLEAEDGSLSWSARVTPLGAPAAAHDLLLLSAPDGLSCLSAAGGESLWKAAGEPLAAPALAGGRVFVAMKGAGKAKAVARAHAIADGRTLWTRDFEDGVIGHAAASEGVVVFPCEELVRVLGAVDGKIQHELPVGKAPVTPALSRDLLVLGAEARVAAFDLASGEWPWNYKDQDHVGTATSPPLIANEAIWVGTSARGLLLFGAAP